MIPSWNGSQTAPGRGSRYGKSILFLELSTVSAYESLEDAPAEYQSLWAEWCAGRESVELQDYSRAGMSAEFGRIVGLTLGYLRAPDQGGDFRLTSWVGDEVRILSEFVRVLSVIERRTPDVRLCAHNGKEFDFPFLAKRLLIHRIPRPAKIDISGVKPWNLPHLDTLELWHHGGRRGYVGLPTLAYLLGIPQPYEWVRGESMHARFYAQGDYESIGKQGQLEVYTTAQVLRCLAGEELLNPEVFRWGEVHRV